MRRNKNESRVSNICHRSSRKREQRDIREEIIKEKVEEIYIHIKSSHLEAGDVVQL
jgi:hypothetical protein